MQSTMQLLEKALAVKRASHWATELELSSGTLTNARNRGRLSPTLAGKLAMKLGENPTQWIAIAAMEAEPETTMLQELKATAETWLHSSLVMWFKCRRKHPRPAVS